MLIAEFFLRYGFENWVRGIRVVSDQNLSISSLEWYSCKCTNTRIFLSSIENPFLNKLRNVLIIPGSELVKPTLFKLLLPSAQNNNAQNIFAASWLRFMAFMTSTALPLICSKSIFLFSEIFSRPFLRPRLAFSTNPRKCLNRPNPRSTPRNNATILKARVLPTGHKHWKATFSWSASPSPYDWSAWWSPHPAGGTRLHSYRCSPSTWDQYRMKSCLRPS